MKHATTVTLGLMLAVTIGMLIWPNSTAQAQPGCKDFQAIVQAWLPTSTPLAPSDTWGGPLFGMLGSDVFLGVVSGNDGDETFRQHMGEGRGGAYTVCVGYPACTDSFTYEVPHAVFPIPPGKGGIVSYYGNTAKIVHGTGRFQNASGNLNVNGPAFVWPDSGSPFGVSGRWNPAISGKVCGIQ